MLVYGDFKDADDALIRMQSMKNIVDHGTGALFYLANHEGRGIGLFSKAMAYVLQENGYDTVEANESLGFVDDSRNYEDAIHVLKTLRTKPVKLMPNNPKKLEAIQNAGLPISGKVPLWGDKSEFNEDYLQTKIQCSGHMKVERTHPND